MTTLRSNQRRRLTEYYEGKATFAQTARTLHLDQQQDLAEEHREAVDAVERETIALLAKRLGIAEPPPPERKLVIK